jgi:hypothetical protein
MHAARKICGENLVDHAMAVEPALAGERCRHDINAEVGLASGPVAGMTAMLLGLIDHLDAVRRESILKLPRDIVFHQHAWGLAPRVAPRQCADVARRDFAAYEKIVKAPKINSCGFAGLRNVKT